MSIEDALRRPSFRSGTPVRLADGRVWTLPTPAFDSFGPHHERLLRAIAEVEDEAEQLRAEMTLAIHLLSLNYHLEPENYQRLLSFPADSPELIEAQHAFHQVAQEHLNRLPASPRVEAKRGWISDLMQVAARCWAFFRGPSSGRLHASEHAGPMTGQGPVPFASDADA